MIFTLGRGSSTEAFKSDYSSVVERDFCDCRGSLLQCSRGARILCDHRHFILAPARRQCSRNKLNPHHDKISNLVEATTAQNALSIPGVNDEALQMRYFGKRVYLNALWLTCPVLPDDQCHSSGFRLFAAAVLPPIHWA
jgi:hypothetical protein